MPNVTANFSVFGIIPTCGRITLCDKALKKYVKCNTVFRSVHL